ncbi:MAG TPA: N-formylglutamate amidohydrolase [Sphingomicrobium sp.]|nr:N-formylglutamate amidohydrolase [Sphingomicrobium sp.]
MLLMGRYPPPTIHRSRCSLPVLLSVPHAGREYDRQVLANAAQGQRALEMLEDPLVDRLCWRAVGAGLGAVIQNVPRAVIDCNRDESEVDPAVIDGIGSAPVGPRARSGLGLIPSRTHRHGKLWRRPIDRTEFDRRIEQVHRPYHQALSDELDTLVGRFGAAILIDCHSMPSRRGQAEVVLGDRYGSSSAAWVAAEAAGIARNAGFKVALNDPYAGGAIVTRHGRPADGVHAIQLEIDRSAYLKPDARTPGVGFDRIACLVETIAVGLGQGLLDLSLRDAAE